MEKEAILELLNESPMRVAELHSIFSEMNVVNIADIFKDENKETDLRIFRLLPKSIASEVFSYIDPDEQQMLIEALSDNEVRDIMSKLFVDDAVDLIEEMPADVVKRVLQNTQNEKRKIINQMLKYPEDSAGSIMTTEYVDLSEDATVNEAFDEIRKNGINKETIYTCYVIRRDRLLVGVVSAKTLMLSKQGDRIGDIMDAAVVSAHTTDDQELVTQQFKKYGLLAMPVVDTENRLVGIITVDDVVQIIEEENTEDFEKMSALKPSEEPYLKTGVFTQVRNRIVWLLFLMLSATITGGIIASFEDALAVLPVLIAFIPMLMDTGGNAGSQSSTLIIRGMALGEVGFKDIAVVLWREVRIGFLCGIILGFINFIRIYLTNGRNSLLAVTVTLSLMLTLMIAKSLGCFLPMVAKKLKVDPAIMAAPLITTIVDGASLWIYFVIAKMMFKL
ncbi:magnesium transporter [Treponema primitia]|uniref:magnesium transporter n=1 Tax=Treponema primitia TaxID=88058 RepID=UPI00397EE4B2